MRIAHVLTYSSSDGAYGGPATVARMQCEALAALGHDVHLFAGSTSAAAGSRLADGFEEHLFAAGRILPGKSFASLHSSDLFRALSLDALKGFDAVHVHLARDLVTLPIALRAISSGRPIIVQPHGMILPKKNPLARTLDFLATRRVLNHAQSVLALTEDEEQSLLELASRARIRRINNGIRVPPELPPVERKNTVLFLSRLHPRKRVLAFIEMAEILAQRNDSLQFVIAGPDEGDGTVASQKIRRSTFASRFALVGGRSQVESAALMRAAAVYVLPSVGEVFPMTMLEAFASGTPTVCTDSLGIAALCEEYEAALVTDGSPESLALAVERCLNGEGARLAAGARRLISAELDIRRIALDLDQMYRETSVHG